MANTLIATNIHSPLSITTNAFFLSIACPGGFAFWIKVLAEQALPEDWSLEGKEDPLCALKGFILMLFATAQSRNLVMHCSDYLIFDTGLNHRRYGDRLYMIAEKNHLAHVNQPYFMKEIVTERELSFRGMPSPERLGQRILGSPIFQKALPLDFDGFTHMLVKRHRLKPPYDRLDRRELFAIVPPALEILRRRINNDREGVILHPFYFFGTGKPSFVGPLCLDDCDRNTVQAAVAITLNEDNGVFTYTTPTILSLEQARLDARIYGKLSADSWLYTGRIPERVSMNEAA